MIDLFNATKTKRSGIVLLVVIAAIPVVVYFYFILKLTVNVPVSDDYGMGLLFLNQFVPADLEGKFKVFFAQHGDHRIALTKSVVLLNHYFGGQINFKFLAIVGNFGLVAVGSVLFKSIPSRYNKWVFLIPITYFLFQLQHWENAGFGTACIQNIYIVSLCLFPLYLIHQQNNKSFYWAIAVAVLATFSSGYGMLVFLIGIVSLVLDKSYKKAGAWSIAAIITIALYYIGFKIHPVEKSFLQTAIEEPDRVLSYLFASLGASMNFENPWEPKTLGFTFSVVLGYLLTIFFLYLIMIRYYLKEKIWFAFFLLLFISCAALVVGRINHYSIDDIPAISRYKIIPISLLIVTLFIIVDLVNVRYRKWVIITIILFSFFYNYKGFTKHLDIFEVHNDRLLRTSWMIHYKNDYSGVVDHDPQYSANTLKEAEGKGIYKIPDFSDRYVRGTRASAPVSLDLPVVENDSLILYDFEILSTSDKEYFAIRNGWAFVKGVPSGASTIYILLKSPKNQYTFDTQYHYREDVTKEYRKSNPIDETDYNSSGFSFKIKSSDIEPGIYKVGIAIENGGHVYQVITDHEIKTSK